MKPRGFTKKRHTFCRDRETYVERFQIQGSTWNSSTSSDWVFYLNAGLFWPDLPEPVENRGVVGTHVYGRLHEFDPASVDRVELREDRLEQTVALVVENVDRVSGAIGTHLAELRKLAVARRFLVGNALRN
jgi:hypothetical protein